MAAAKYDMEIEQGVHFYKRFIWRDKDGNPFNLTGYSARMQVRPAPDKTPIYLDLSDGSGITLGGEEGTIEIDVVHTLTSSLNFNAAAYDLELYAPSGRPKRLLEGIVTLSREITDES